MELQLLGDNHVSGDDQAMASATHGKSHPLPTRHVTIDLGQSYSASEMDNIRVGLIPKRMHDRWFVYFDKDTLHLHRSWTGFCVYQVLFEQRDDGFVAVRARVNADPSQYKRSSNDEERETIGQLIAGLLLRRAIE